MAGAAQPPWGAASSLDKRAIADLHAVPGHDGVLGKPYQSHLLRKHDVDPAFGPEVGGTDQKALECLFTREVILGQRRPFIWKVSLTANYRDRPVETCLAQGDRGLRSAMAGTGQL